MNIAGAARGPDQSAGLSSGCADLYLPDDARERVAVIDNPLHDRFRMHRIAGDQQPRGFREGQIVRLVEGGRWIGSARAAFDGVVVVHYERLDRW